MKTLQNFFKTTVAIDWAVGTGKRYVTTLPTPTSGWLVVSPNNSSLREIVAYDVVGTDGTGNFITITARGVGGTTEQTHSVNEPVRMNITAEHWADIYNDPVFTGNVTVPTPTDGTDAVTKDYVDGLAIAGSPDAGVATKGIGKTSVAPASASNPIFVGDNDPRVPTQDENDALVGTSGTPSTSNPYTTKATTDLKVSQSGAEVYASAGGTANAITVTLSPVPSAYTTGMKVAFKATATNTGATTINVNSLGAKSLINQDGSSVLIGQIQIDSIVECVYDGTNFQIQPLGTRNAFNVSTDLSNSFYTVQASISPLTTTTASGWTCSTTTFTTSSAAGYFLLQSSGSANFEMSTSLLGTTSNSNYSIASNKVIRIKTRLKFLDLSDRKGFGLCITPANIHTAHTDTTNGEVRFILNSSTLYAQNANGTTATSTNISSGLTLTNWNTFEIVFTPGTDAKFYVNGTLRATHTTNLPTTGTPVLAYGVNANGRQIETSHPVISYEI